MNDVTQLLYKYFLIHNTYKNTAWVVLGQVNIWCNSECVPETFRSVDGKHYHLHGGFDRPKNHFAIPFKLFFASEFNVD